MEACDNNDQPVPPQPGTGTGQVNPGKKRRKVGRRACDGCIVRKVKCSETPPCVRCVKVGIPCTFNKRPRKRGPHHLRDKTIHEINIIQSQSQSQAQSQETEQLQIDAAESSGRDTDQGPASGVHSDIPCRTTSIQALILRLCIFRVRLFPVWPIVAVDELIAALHRNPVDLEAYALANAIGAATIAQLGLGPDGAADAHDTVTAGAMEAECQKVKAQLQVSASAPSASLDILRAAFFLHIYHENQVPGGPRSLLYLREAITIAQIMGLHRESSYRLLSVGEQHARRRALWLLFVTERGVAVLHNLPPIITWNTSFPSLDVDTGVDGDETYVFPAFRQLVNLFWTFDQSGIFDVIGDAGGQQLSGSLIEQGLRLLHQQLQTPPFGPEPSNDTQKADVSVTRLWMQAVTWKMLRSLNRYRTLELTSSSTIHHPIHIAKDLLVLISTLPKAAIEAHGPTIEYKIFEIASSVIDSMTAIENRSTRPVPVELSNSFQIMPPGYGHVLLGLQRLLASCRSSGNQTLLDMFQGMMAGIGDLSCFRVDRGIILVSTRAERRILPAGEGEDRRMDGSDEGGAESCSLVTPAEHGPDLGCASSEMPVPWLLTTVPGSECQTRYLHSAGVPARRSSRETGTQRDGFVEHSGFMMATDGNLWGLPVDGSVLLDL